jgi:hypothetical protein
LSNKPQHCLTVCLTKLNCVHKTHFCAQNSLLCTQNSLLCTKLNSVSQINSVSQNSILSTHLHIFRFCCPNMAHACFHWSETGLEKWVTGRHLVSLLFAGRTANVSFFLTLLIDSELISNTYHMPRCDMCCLTMTV